MNKLSIPCATEAQIIRVLKENYNYNNVSEKEQKRLLKNARLVLSKNGIATTKNDKVN